MAKNLKNKLKFFNHPEGYIEPDGFGNFDYIYQYKDHLGNIRLSYKLDGMETEMDSFNDGTTGSWGAHSSTISNEDDQLKVVLTDAEVGVFKVISVTAGEALTINLDLEMDTTDKVSLYEYTTGKLSDLVDGHNQINYTPTVSGDFILLIVKDPTSIDVGTQTHFYLDNIGVTVGEDELVIVEENNFYPFGLRHKGYNSNVISEHKYQKYNGKEYEESLGLDMYEMDLRQYDPAIGRFISLDPVTHHDVSPYQSFNNNPIYWADPSGADVTITEGGNNIKFTGQDAIDAFKILLGNSGSSESSDSEEGGDKKCDDCKEGNTRPELQDRGRHFAKTGGSVIYHNGGISGHAGWYSEANYFELYRPMVRAIAQGKGSMEWYNLEHLPDNIRDALNLWIIQATDYYSTHYDSSMIGNAEPMGLDSPFFGPTGIVKFFRLLNTEKLVGANFLRFVKKAPSNAKSSATSRLMKDGNYLFEATSAGKVPGSKAVYQKIVSPRGKTLNMQKTTYAPDGTVVHVKSKM